MDAPVDGVSPRTGGALSRKRCDTANRVYGVLSRERYRQSDSYGPRAGWTPVRVRADGETTSHQGWLSATNTICDSLGRSCRRTWPPRRDLRPQLRNEWVHLCVLHNEYDPRA